MAKARLLMHRWFKGGEGWAYDESLQEEFIKIVNVLDEDDKERIGFKASRHTNYQKNGIPFKDGFLSLLIEQEQPEKCLNKNARNRNPYIMIVAYSKEKISDDEIFPHMRRVILPDVSASHKDFILDTAAPLREVKPSDITIETQKLRLEEKQQPAYEIPEVALVNRGVMPTPAPLPESKLGNSVAKPLSAVNKPNKPTGKTKAQERVVMAPVPNIAQEGFEDDVLSGIHDDLVESTPFPKPQLKSSTSEIKINETITEVTPNEPDRAKALTQNITYTSRFGAGGVFGEPKSKQKLGDVISEFKDRYKLPESFAVAERPRFDSNNPDLGRKLAAISPSQIKLTKENHEIAIKIEGLSEVQKDQLTAMLGGEFTPPGQIKISYGYFENKDSNIEAKGLFESKLAEALADFNALGSARKTARMLEKAASKGKTAPGL